MDAADSGIDDDFHEEAGGDRDEDIVGTGLNPVVAARRRMKMVTTARRERRMAAETTAMAMARSLAVW